MDFLDSSADAFIEHKKDCYFDNDSILFQFERLFKMLKFKTELFGHKLEILVDNARTHSSKLYDINLLGKRPGTACPYQKLEWSIGELKTLFLALSNFGLKKYFWSSLFVDYIESPSFLKSVF